MNIDDEILAAHARTQAVIDASYERARRWWMHVFNEGRRANGYQPLVILMDRHHCIAPDRYRCPECGGRLHVEIEAWESFSGRPEDGIVICENENWEGADYHDHRWFDWDSITEAVRRWARANVRVL